jgi:hypothetical protein
MADTETVPVTQEEKMAKIVEYLEEGLWFKDACQMVGIDESTGHRWKKENPEADNSFASRVEAGIMVYKRKMIKCVTLGSIKDAKVALEVLRVRFPEDWNVAKKFEHGGPVATAMQEIADSIQEMIKGTPKADGETDTDNQTTGQ